MRKKLIFLVFVVTFLFFAPNLNDGFLSDDFDFLARMDFVHDLPSAWQQINPAYQGFWRPVLNTSFLFNYLMFGEQSAWSYHLVNNLLHALITVLIFLIAEKIFKNKSVAFLSAVFFAIYPMHHESVTWIAGRTDVLAAFFYSLALYLAIKYFSDQNRKFLYGSYTVFIMAILTKEMSLTWPAVIFLIDVFWFGRKSFSHYLKTYGPLILVVALYFVGRYFSIHQWLGGYNSGAGTIHLNFPIKNILASPIYYFSKIVNYEWLAKMFSWGSWIDSIRKYLVIAIVGGMFCLQIFYGRIKSLEFWKITSGLLVIYIVSAVPVWAMLPGIQKNGMDSRFLYFPTIFGSILLAYWLWPKNILNKKILIVARSAVGGFLALFIWFFMVNYMPWAGATVVRDQVLAEQADVIRKTAAADFWYVPEAPDNYYGAYVFRNGWQEALENYLQDESLFIAPDNTKILLLKNKK